MRSLKRLAKSTCDVRGVPEKAKRTTPVDGGFRTAEAEGENPTRTMPDGTVLRHNGLEHGGTQADRRRKTIAPRIEGEPHAENADEGAVAVRPEGEFVHAKNVA